MSAINPNPTYTVTRGELFEDFEDEGGEGEHDYGGSFYSLMFRVDRLISLEALSFFGPTRATGGTYDVKIEIFEPILRNEIFPSPQIRNRIVTLHQRGALAGNGAIFQVGFERLLPVRPNVWHLIQFKLEGPETARCRWRSIQNRRSVTTDNGVVNFQFGENGTRQLPKIHFKVPACVDVDMSTINKIR